jgi:DNA-directed RNA polymerase specialized sigma54-like protein
MFGYVGDLTLTQGLQVDLASVLRLEIDALQGQRLAGQPVDLARLSTAFAMLQNLLPQSVAAPRVRESTRIQLKISTCRNDNALRWRLIPARDIACVAASPNGNADESSEEN